MSLNEHRQAARLDVLAIGLVLHQTLTGMALLDEPDIAQVIRQLPPFGRELVRLPWNTPKPVADALRAIANRATDRQPRQRYASARSLLRALDGWIKSDSINGGEPLALLIDRLLSVGVLRRTRLSTKTRRLFLHTHAAAATVRVAAAAVAAWRAL